MLNATTDEHADINYNPVFESDIFNEIEKEFDNLSKNVIINLLNSFGNEIRDSYNRRKPISSLERKCQDNKPNIHYVSPSSLPNGYGWKALGLYDSSTHSIYIANNLSPEVENFVYWHEIAHSLGIVDEKRADDFAASKTGYRLRGRTRAYSLGI